MARKFPLLTRNARHFARIPGLTLAPLGHDQP
jgi:predicted nucleic acid-binding protein